MNAEEKKLIPGIQGHAEMVIKEQDLANMVGSGDLPVLATPAMAALMEAAAVNSLLEKLPPGETTVGVKLDISHLAATPKGKKVFAKASLEQIEGKKLVFTLLAWDEIERIGQGKHERIIIQRDKFMKRIESK